MRNAFPVKKCLLAVLIALSVSSANAQFAGVTAGVAANQLISGLDGLINSARDAGDYLYMKAAMDAKGVIETWKDANKELLDDAFEKLSDQQRSLFANTRQIYADVNAKAEDRLRQAADIMNQANQTVVSLPLNKKTYVTQFYPRVIPSQTTSTLIVKVKGVNLDAAEPYMAIADTKAERMIVGPMEVHYTLDLTKLPRDPDKLVVIPLTLTYDNLKDGIWNSLMGNRETVQRQIPVVALPTNIGRYTYTATVETERKVVKQHSSQPQRMEGRNTDRRVIASPPAGWQWDLEQGPEAFTQHGAGGRAGSCHGIFINESKKDGIVHGAHLDERREVRGFPPRVVYGPGHQNCYVSGPVFKPEKTIKTLPAETGILTWTEDVRIPVPAGLKSHRFEVTTFDGRKRVFTDSGNDKFFDVLMGPGASQFVVQPNPPKDI